MKRLRWGWVVSLLVLLAVGGATWWSLDGVASPRTTQTECRRIEQELRLHAATGQPRHLRAAVESLRRLLPRDGAATNSATLAMQVRVDLALHHFAAASAGARILAERFPDQPFPSELEGDALFALGDLAGAEAALERLAARGGSRLACEWRRAQLALARGQTAEARRLMAEVVALAREPGSGLTPEGIAWYEVRQGEAAFRAGDWEMAENAYAAALALAPASFSAREHLAELRGAQRRIEEAETLYRALIQETGRPELMQALGDLYRYLQRPHDAATWHQQALAGYRRQDFPEAADLYHHHLAGFYADSLGDFKAAADAARCDLQLRGTADAHDALAWALHGLGELEEAARESDLALAGGSRDPHLLYHAGLIRMARGEIAAGRARLREALDANPRYQSFHVHR